jgi:uncharacterized protein (DUF2147 family)
MNQQQSILGDNRMIKKQLVLSACLFGLLAGNVSAQASDPAIGVWKTIDDKTNEPSSLIKIEEVNGKLEGTIIKTFPKPNEKPLVYCTLCKDDRKDKPILGMKIMTDLKRDKPGAWSDGRILDPEEGEIYRVKVTTEDGKKMDVRGYIGVPLLGRTQFWYKAEQ